MAAAPQSLPELLSLEEYLRLDDFLGMPVEHIWLLAPIERVAYTYSAVGPALLVQEPRMSIPNSPIYPDLPELFSALD